MKEGRTRLSYGTRCAYCREEPAAVGPLLPYLTAHRVWLVLCSPCATNYSFPWWRVLLSRVLTWWKMRGARRRLLTP